MNDNPKNKTITAPDYHEYVAKIDKLILDYIDGGGQRTTAIGGVMFQYASLSDLERLRSKYAALAQAQDAAQGKIRNPAVINSRLYV